jgi:hypothetical protein
MPQNNDLGKAEALDDNSLGPFAKYIAAVLPRRHAEVKAS